MSWNIMNSLENTKTPLKILIRDRSKMTSYFWGEGVNNFFCYCNSFNLFSAWRRDVKKSKSCMTSFANVPQWRFWAALSNHANQTINFTIIPIRHLWTRMTYNYDNYNQHQQYHQAFENQANERSSQIFWDAVSMTSSDRNSIALSVYHSVPELHYDENAALNRQKQMEKVMKKVFHRLPKESENFHCSLNKSHSCCQ